MDKQELTKLLNSVAAGSVTPDEAALQLKLEPFHEVGGYARVDFHRGIRQGVPEVIYGEGKTKEHMSEATYLSPRTTSSDMRRATRGPTSCSATARAAPSERRPASGQ